MKALFHMSGRCGSIRSPRADGSWTFCDCGQAAMRWTDPGAGKAEVWSADPDSARIIGLNNAVLTFDAAFNTLHGLSDEGWRNLHTSSCQAVSNHYLFSDTRRDCWAVLFRPGDTGDVTRVAQKPLTTARLLTDDE